MTESLVSNISKEALLLAAELASVDDPGRTPPRLPKRAFSIREVEQTTDLSHATIYRLIRTGRLRTIKVLGRRLVPAEALDDLLKGVA
jgi:excisionase family DNA binding protein